MTNIKDFIDNIFFLLFKRYIFKKNDKKNNYFEEFPETFKFYNEDNIIDDINDNEDNNNEEEILFLRELKI
jgi:hypothetical protein